MNFSATLAVLFSSISSAAAQTTTPDDESMELIESLGLKDELPKPGYNMEGGSVFDNYVKARRDGQFFLLMEGIVQFERPLSEPKELSVLQWCSNLHFTSNSNGTYSRGVGYTAQCVGSFLGDSYSKVEAIGAQLPHILEANEFGVTRILSASYNTQSNMFNMVYHNNNDNNVWQFYDTGLSSMPYLGWETHDEGDDHPNAHTSSWSGTGQMKWLSAEEASLFVVTNYTGENFDMIYEKVWNDEHVELGSIDTEEVEESTDTDMEEADEDGGNTEDSMTAAKDTEEDDPESDTEEEEDESSANNGRRLFVAITSMFSTLLGSSV